MQNEFSRKTLKANSLNSKVQCFRSNFINSHSMVMSKSSLYNLAAKKNSDWVHTPKIVSKSQKSPKMNPQHLVSDAMKGLGAQTEQLHNLATLNTELLLEKRKLQQRIEVLRQEISKEVRNKHKISFSSMRHDNQIDKKSDHLQNNYSVRTKVQETAAEYAHENYMLRKEIDVIKAHKQEVIASIAHEKVSCEQLDSKIAALKVQLLHEDKLRNSTKQQLQKHQKVMLSASTRIKELENEKAFLLLEINKVVLINKL